MRQPGTWIHQRVDLAVAADGHFRFDEFNAEGRVQ